MNRVLFSRPAHDVQVNYLHHYSKELVKIAESKGWDVLNKEKENANSKIILSLIEKKKPHFIMFNGHGSAKEIFGHKDELIISSDKNPQVLKEAVVYALACSCAIELGVKSCEVGTKSFIGYLCDFALGKDPNSEAAPGRDRIAKLFLEPSNLLVNSILNGKSIEVAVIKAKDKMFENIWHLNTTTEFPEAPFYAPYLYANYASLIAYGDTSISFQ